MAAASQQQWFMLLHSGQLGVESYALLQHKHHKQTIERILSLIVHLESTEAAVAAAAE